MTDNFNLSEEVSEGVDEINETVISDPTEYSESNAEGEAVAEVENTEHADIAPEIDYEALIAKDVATLKAEFPELSGIRDVTDLDNPLRYAALRDLGLSPIEAYLATARRSVRDTRSHLRSAHGRSAGRAECVMSQHELASARELFPGKNDAELQRLYKKVTK